MDNKWVILIDFDNQYNFSAYTDDFAWLKSEINYYLDQIIELSSRNVTYVTMKLYGGWMKDGMFTNLSSRLQQAITTFDYFPIYIEDQKRMIHGEIELVTRLIDLPDIYWKNTVREKNGLPKIRLKNPGLPMECVGTKSDCPVRIFYRFTRKKTKKCPADGCQVTNERAFKIIEQKMIDTMIACDLISLSVEEKIDGMLIASDDYDLIPPVAIASKNMGLRSKQICLFRKSFQLDDEISSDLKELGALLKFKE